MFVRTFFCCNSEEMKRLAAAFVCLLLVVSSAVNSSPLAAKFVDAIVAQVDLYTIAASDVALASELGIYGLRSLEGPIRGEDIDRFIDARLIIAEAERLKMAPPAEVLESAWREAATRKGGTSRLREWLEENGISDDWARRLVHGDARRKYFAELRFERFVFIPEEEITRALGPGSHAPDERERVRAALRKQQAARNLASWLQEQRKRAKIRRFNEGETIPNPLDSNASDEGQS
jgi:hypothetical protein